jgi:hypothetical protein
MSYQPKFIRRRVRRIHKLATCWILDLECAHEVKAKTWAAANVRNPVCPICNGIAADVGRAKRLSNDLPQKVKA